MLQKDKDWIAVEQVGLASDVGDRKRGQQKSVSAT